MAKKTKKTSKQGKTSKAGPSAPRRLERTGTLVVPLASSLDDGYKTNRIDTTLTPRQTRGLARLWQGMSRPPTPTQLVDGKWPRTPIECVKNLLDLIELQFEEPDGKEKKQEENDTTPGDE